MISDLGGKRAVVTAAAAGIGFAITKRLMAEDVKVHASDIDGAALCEAATALPGLTTTAADVADETQVETLFAEAEKRLGGLDILVNCAGIAGPTGAIEEIAPDDWRRTIAVNLDATYLCSARAVPLLRAAGGGSIVNLSSTAGLMGYPNRAPYAAAKWAVIGLTKSLAMELGGDAIRVNAICPGSVEGERMDRVIEAEALKTDLDPDHIRQGYARSSSLGSFVTADDIAAMVLFLCADAGAKISGQALAVDGHTESLSG